MDLRKILVAGLMIGFLASCSSVATSIKSGIVNDAEFNLLVIEDVEQSLLLATESGDALGFKCWTYIHDFALANAPEEGMEVGTVVGFFSAYQKARNVRRTVQLEISDDFRLECGPMLTESLGVLSRIAIRFGT